MVDVECTRCAQPVQRIKDIKNIWPRPHVSKPARADASRDERSISPTTAWKDMKRDNYRKQDVTVFDLAQNKNVSLPPFFFLSIAYLSQFLSFWVKCSSFLFLTTRLSVGVLLSPVSKIEAVKRLTRGRQTTPRGYLYTNEICK